MTAPLPTLLLELVIFAVSIAYITGIARLWKRAGWGHGLPAWRAACFLAGMAILGYSLAGRMDALADRSFAAHMFQHVLLMKVIPPLLLLGEFSVVFLRLIGGRTAHRASSWWLQSRFMGSAWGKLNSPWFAWAFFALCMWLWHAPPFYQAALKDEWLHAFEHLMFFGSSLFFWWYVLRPGADRATRYGLVALMLFTTLMHESVLGALLAFASKSWYAFYAAPDPWGISPLADQQLAGMIMWIPGGVLFGFLIEYYFGAWLRAIERRMQAAHPEYAHTGDRHD